MVLEVASPAPVCGSVGVFLRVWRGDWLALLAHQVHGVEGAQGLRTLRRGHAADDVNNCVHCNLRELLCER